MLTINNIKKSVFHHNDVFLFSNITLKLSVGEWVSIVGPSGAGKTTLLNCIAGIYKIDEGTIELDGMEIHNLTDNQSANMRRLHIGFVFQDFKLLPYYSVLENVILPLSRDKNRKHLMGKAEKLLKQVGIDESYYNRLPSALSGGEKQRVAIARGLINNPKLIICDEPTGNLDNDNKRQVLNILDKLRKKGHSIIVVTHDEEVALEGDRIYELRNGLLNEMGVKDVQY